VGLGDELMAAGQARELKRLHLDKRVLVGTGKLEYRHPMFFNNPNIDITQFKWERFSKPVHRKHRFTKPGPIDGKVPGNMKEYWREKRVEIAWVLNYPGGRPYIDHQRTTRLRWIWNREFRAVRGDFFPTDREVAEAEELLSGVSEPFGVIEPNVKGTTSADNKDWGWTRWIEVIKATHGWFSLVQLGGKHSKVLPHVRRIETPEFRVAFTILRKAAFFVGTEGGLHHAAAAFNLPAVVIFGGYISPEQTGYAMHENLYYVDHPLSPCGMRRTCAHCRQAMDRIKVGHVVERLERFKQ
jgi:hypothetical protein